MRKIFILVVVIASVMLIYKSTNRSEILVFSIGNNHGDIVYNPENARITDIILDIEKNKEIEDKYMQNILVKASHIEIDITSFVSLNNYKAVLSQMEDLEKLFALLRKYSKEKIEIKLLTEQSEIARYTNHKIAILSKNYDIIITR